VQAIGVTQAEFFAFIRSADHANRHFELIGGEIVESMPSDLMASNISARLIYLLMTYLETHDIGHVTGEAGGYHVGTDVYAPNVAFIRYERLPRLASKGFGAVPPDLAVEVVSTGESDENARLTVRLSSYLAVVWIVRPDMRRVEVHTPGQGPRILTQADELDGGSLLPGFRIRVETLFSKTAS
jgi:Uma2 family endonuclease